MWLALLKSLCRFVQSWANSGHIKMGIGDKTQFVSYVIGFRFKKQTV